MTNGAPLNANPNPVDRFANLPEETREWLEQLRPQDIVRIQEALDFVQSAKTVGKFWRWAIITTTSIFMGVTLLGEKLIWWWKWFTGAVK